MKRIFVIILAVSAFLASCSSPYYPEYVRVVSLGANTSSLMCENTEGETKRDYKEVAATLSFLDTVELTCSVILTYEGNTCLVET